MQGQGRGGRVGYLRVKWERGREKGGRGEIERVRACVRERAMEEGAEGRVRTGIGKDGKERARGA